MKKIYLVVILFSILSCQDPKFEDYIFVVNQDSLMNSLPVQDSLVGDSTFSLELAGETPSSIILDSIKYFIVEGDILLTEYEFSEYKLSNSLKKNEIFESNQDNKLIVDKIKNKIVKWPDGIVLKYCINKRTFQSIDKYNLVREKMKFATDDWASTCNVKFFYDESKDSKDLYTAPSDLTFVVLGYESYGDYIASSFFPYDPLEKRKLLIDPSYFTEDFDQTGVLRHELGHILGFRHEHIMGDAPMVCKKESIGNATPLTVYDPKSVMHYFCGEKGSKKLEITELDKKGSQLVYGQPK